MVRKITTTLLAAALASLGVLPTVARAADAQTSDTTTNPKDVDRHETAKGAAAGAVAGHFAGGHALTGAVVGGTAGAMKKHHDRKKVKEAQQKQQEEKAEQAH